MYDLLLLFDVVSTLFVVRNNAVFNRSLKGCHRIQSTNKNLGLFFRSFWKALKVFCLTVLLPVLATVNWTASLSRCLSLVFILFWMWISRNPTELLVGFKLLTFRFECNALTHFMAVFYYTPWKQKIRDYLMFSRSIERDQWHKMG